MNARLSEIRAGLAAAVSGSAPGRAAANSLCLACVDLLEVDGAAVSVILDVHPEGTFGSSNALSRRLDEYQFTYGEGPCIDAVGARDTVHAPDLDSPTELRWPLFTEAALGDGVRSVFAIPIMLSSQCVGALDLFRDHPGPLTSEHLAGAAYAARLAALPLLHLAGADTSDGAPDPAQMVLHEGEQAWGQLSGMDRIEVYQATGVLISQLGVSAEEAMARLRAHAVATNRTASDVAWGILEGRLIIDVDPHDETRGGTR